MTEEALGLEDPLLPTVDPEDPGTTGVDPMGEEFLLLRCILDR